VPWWTTSSTPWSSPRSRRRPTPPPRPPAEPLSLPQLQEHPMADPAAARILVINSGSSSLKFQLLDPADGTVDAAGIVERVGQDSGEASITAGEQESSFAGPVPDHKAAMRIVQSLLTDVGLSLSDDRIRAVGHRVVQGGARYSEPVRIDDQVRWDIHDLGKLAPLHNYAAVDGIDGAMELLPEVPHVAMFDTAFFTALPEAAANYALNREVASEYKVRRYGAHGTSHQYVSREVSRLLAEIGKLAPLQNYGAVDGIDGAMELLPEVPHVAVFDTAFFTALPEAAANYALNREVASEYKVRRYGAHGTSHQYVSREVSRLLA